jgi:DNA-binding LytR/AlgR family response regulator
MRIEALSSYSRLFFSDGKTLVVARTLRWFQQQLPLRQFIRTHRSHLVNRNFIDYTITGLYSKVQLVNGEQVTVSKRKRKLFRSEITVPSLAS